MNTTARQPPITRDGASNKATPSPAESSPRKFGRARIALVVLAGVILFAWVGLDILAHRAGPALRARVVRDIDQRFNGHAELDSLRISVFPRVSVSGDGLVLRTKEGETGPPLISIRHFSAEGSPWGLLAKRVSSVHLTGLSIVLPPGGERPKLEQKPENKPVEGKSKAGFVIGRIVTDDAHLELLTDKPGKQPLQFEIKNLVMNSAGPGHAMPFTATLINAKPIGDIATHGEFGPWNTDEPCNTPVSGTYSFTQADLATIHGIGGILSSNGQFNGVLGRIEVRGETQTPNFQVSTGGHPMPLNTTFSATVDGTTGDTYLHPVDAKLADSEIIANGSVVRDANGRKVTLDVTCANAQIQDLLKVAVKTDPPALSGPVTLHTSFLLPPDGAPVPDRLQLNGTFSIKEAHFEQPKVQDKLDNLSARAEGNPKEAQQSDAPEVLSDLKGNFKLDNGVISLSNLTFAIPGGLITLAGDYHLEDRQFSFEGTARFKAEVSQMTTGVKSFFLKAIDPIFAKQGAGTVIPIRVSGAGTKPKVGIDLGKPKRAQ